MGSSQSYNREMLQYKNNDRIGIFKHIQINGQTFVEVVRQIPSQKIYNKWVQRIKNVKISMIGADSVYLPAKHHYNNTELCGSGGNLQIVYPEWQNILKEEISNRRKIQNFYTQQQIWYIFYSILKAGVLYEGNNQKLGDMHPNNIIVTPKGQIKVITRDSFPLQQTNFEKIVEQIKSDVYLAPEQLDYNMIESGFYSIKEPSKADTFSFAITMLSTITLQDCSYIYIRNPLRISQQKLQGYVSIMKNRYSQFLYNIMRSILEINPFKRKGFLQLYQSLRPFQQKIIHLQSFLSRKILQKQKQGGFERSVESSRINNSIKSSQTYIFKNPYSPPSQELVENSKKVNYKL